MPQTNVFSDNFNRPDGAVGNGWLQSPGSIGGTLQIVNDVLSGIGNSGGAGIFRSIDMSGSVSVSADLTPTSGFGGLHLRYVSQILFGSTGSLDNGYGLLFYRGDQNFSNSAVGLQQDGVTLSLLPSSFQFGDHIHVSFTLLTTGEISGSVTDGVSTFNFDFAGGHQQYHGSNLEIDLGLPDGRAAPSAQVEPTLDNFSLNTAATHGGGPPPDIYFNRFASPGFQVAASTPAISSDNPLAALGTRNAIAMHDVETSSLFQEQVLKLAAAVYAAEVNEGAGPVGTVASIAETIFSGVMDSWRAGNDIKHGEVLVGTLEFVQTVDSAISNLIFDSFGIDLPVQDVLNVGATFATIYAEGFFTGH